MSLHKLRSRLETVKSLDSIFAALQVVTVVRTQKARQAFAAVNKYLSALREPLAGKVISKPLPGKVLVVITSNRGLCGGFNHTVAATANRFLESHPEAKIVLVGGSGHSLMRDRMKQILFFDNEVIEKPAFAPAARLFRRIYELNSEIYLACNEYKSTLVQIPGITKISPQPQELAAGKDEADFIMEPDRALLIDRLYFHYLETLFFRYLLSSYMGEMSARFMVLKGAVDNSREIVDGLVLRINKKRQAGITEDLLEIVTAAEAMRRDYD